MHPFVQRCKNTSLLLFGLTTLAISAAHAQYSFQTIGDLGTLPDNYGRNIVSGVTLDTAGNLYGTSSNDRFNDGPGIVYKLTANGTGGYTLSNLAQFGGDLGGNPEGTLVRDPNSGNFIGTTRVLGRGGNGTIYQVTPGGTITPLTQFNQPGVPGLNPVGGVLLDGSGNIYGTTVLGGTTANFTTYGTVFRRNTDGSVTTLADFGALGANAGRLPYAGLARDNQGNLYGTAFNGGTNDKGTLFKITAGGAFSVLADFGALGAGTNPYGRVTVDGAGNIYGTTLSGGTNGLTFGTVFKLAANGMGGYSYNTLTSFDNVSGATPYAGVLLDGAGNIYGDTFAGGTNNIGTVFKLTNNGGNNYAFATIADFGLLVPNGQIAGPKGDLTIDGAGNLYGTTSAGGTAGAGTIFKLTPTITTAPEISSFALLAVGGVVGGWAARRRKETAR